MACSNPLRLYETDIKKSNKVNHSDFRTHALRNSMGNDDYFTVPCRYCLNCRVDRQNELVDRCEYEYIQYGCGAFVTFTYDDYHLFKNQFLDSKTNEIIASINKKDGKDFLNRLNKLVHKENKKTGFNPLCRKDYKYVITHEYGDSFNRPHIHCLFFGLDFAYCERIFWKAWQFQGSIEVGAIKNGGIAYTVKYISSQEYGLTKLFKYDYHHLSPPCSSHSVGLGQGLYKSQIKYIKKTGNYLWHNKERPVPTYWKNKLKVISDLDSDRISKKYMSKCNNINNLYNHKITSYKDFKETNLLIARTRQLNLMEKLKQNGKQVLDQMQLYKDYNAFIYADNHRLPSLNESALMRIIKPDGTELIKVGKAYKKTLSTRDLMKMHTDYYKLTRQYGENKAAQMLGLQSLPF